MAERAESALLYVCLKSETSEETELHSTFRRFLGADPRTRGARTQTPSFGIPEQMSK